MTQAKVTVNRPDAADEELIDVLTSISVVSMRLARKLTMLACQKGANNPIENRKGRSNA